MNKVKSIKHSRAVKEMLKSHSDYMLHYHSITGD